MAEITKMARPLNHFLDLIRQGERKRLPLLNALKGAIVDVANIGQFVDALHSRNLMAPVTAEFIDSVWLELDHECKNQLLRDWLNGRELEQQAFGYHVLAARFLSHDEESAMMLLDRVLKLASTSEPCRRRAISTTRNEWIGDALGQTRYRSLTAAHLSDRKRLVLLNWLTDACIPDFKPTDPENRKSDLKRQAEGRGRVLSEWMVQRSKEPAAPGFLVDALNAQLTRLGHVPGSVATQTEPSRSQPAVPVANENKVPISASSPPRVEIQFPPSGNSKLHDNAASPALDTAPSARNSPAAELKSSVGPAAHPAAAKKLREALSSVEQIFGRELEQHSKELQTLTTELEAAKAEAAKAKQDAAAHRDRAAKSLEWTTELEKEFEAVKAAGDANAKEAEHLRRRLDQVGKELEELAGQNRSLREESREAIAREMARERDRLLMQVGQRIGNIVSNYREVRARGALPEGSPAMIGAMMDEMLNRLEALGVKFAREQ